jgi:hypothetical protein
VSSTDGAAPSALHAAIAQVMSALERLPKTGRNREQGYAFARDADVLDAVRQRMGAAGITLVQELEALEREERPTRGGGSMVVATATFWFILTHAPSGERERYRFVGVGADSGDKWFTKASTSAEKYFLMRLFLLSSGEDPDASSPESGPAQAQARHLADEGDRLISKAQTERLWARARKVGVEEGTVRRIVDYATAGEARDEEGVPHVGRLTKAHYDRVVALVERYPREEAEAERELRRWEDEERLVEGAARVLDGRAASREESL